MLDFGFFTLPAIAAAAVFITALFIGEDIVIEKISVPTVREWNGYNATVATRQLTDQLRELSVAAASELTALNIDEGGLEKGISAFEDYFEVGLLINGTRNVMGLIKYYINGEITEINGEAHLAVRIYTKDEAHPVKLISVKGDPADLDGLLHRGAVKILEQINPYVVALYHRRIELEAKKFDFPKTREVIARYIADQPVERHFLAYGLLGRMHMLKAELDTALTPEQREAEYAEAVRNLEAALRQEPDFLYPLINLGIIAAGKKDYAKADGYFAHAVRVNPNYLVTRSLWGKMLAEQGRSNDAIVQYVAAVELAPKDPDLRTRLAELYDRVGLTKEARKQAEKALKLAPASRDYAEKLDALDRKTASP